MTPEENRRRLNQIRTTEAPRGLAQSRRGSGTNAHFDRRMIPSKEKSRDAAPVSEEA
jgi:hypothetical protein